MLILSVVQVQAFDYTLQSNCLGYDWNGLGCVEVGQNSTVPVGYHTVTIGGLNITNYPVIFVTNTTTKELWIGMSSLVAVGYTEGTLSFNVTEADIGNKLYYQSVVFGFYGTLIFVAADDASVISSTGDSSFNDTASTADWFNLTDVSSSASTWNATTSSTADWTETDGTAMSSSSSGTDLTDYSSSASSSVSSTGVYTEQPTTSSGIWIETSSGVLHDGSSAATLSVAPVAIGALSMMVAVSVRA